MAIGDSTSLLFRIKGDASDAIRAFKQTETGASGLSGSLAGLANPAALAATAVAAIGTAAAGAGLALFNVAKAASDYGSEIFDASEKTGLAAETLSSIKFAAEQAGSSLEAVTGGLARFAKTIGEATDGNEKAQAKLRELGVTSTDLDTALGQALQTIARYPAGVQQMTAAQAAFGKSGADLLPFIKSFDGDLPGLIAKCKELGLTIDGKTAKAADDFGDSLDTLTKQLGLVGRTIGVAVIPAFTKLFTDLSGWLAKNKTELEIWAGVVEKIFNGVVAGAKNFVDGILDAASLYRNLAGAIAIGGGGIAAGYQRYLDEAQERRRLSLGPDVGESYLSGGRRSGDVQNAGGGVIDPATGKVKTQTVGRADNQGDFNRADREQAEKELAEQIAFAKQLAADRIEIFEAEAKKRYEIAQEYAEKEGRTDADMAKFKEVLEEEVLRFRIEKLEKYLAKVRELGGVDAAAAQELQVLKIDAETLEVKHRNNQAKRNADEKKENDARVQSWNDYVQKLKEAQEKEDARAEKAADAANRKKFEEGSVLQGGGVGQGIGDALGVNLVSLFDQNDKIKQKADFLQEVFSDLKQGIGGALGEIAGGIANMVTAWVTGSDISAKAALKMAAGVAIGLAFQAGIKAIFEVAEGFAALAITFGVPNPASIAHFAAAAQYGIVAGVAGGAGIALGLASRAAGGGSRSASGAFASQTASSTGRNTDAQGQQYSSREDGRILSGSRNQPSERRIVLALDDRGLLAFLKNDYDNNGTMREIVVAG